MWRLHLKSSSNEEVTCVILIQSNEVSMWCHYDVFSHMVSPSSNEEMPLVNSYPKVMRIACGVIMMFCLIWEVLIQ